MTTGPKDAVHLRLYSVEDVRERLRMKNARAVYRHAGGNGILAPYVRHLGPKRLLFDAAGIDALIAKILEDHR